MQPHHLIGDGAYFCQRPLVLVEELGQMGQLLSGPLDNALRKVPQFAHPKGHLLLLDRKRPAVAAAFPFSEAVRFKSRCQLLLDEP